MIDGKCHNYRTVITMATQAILAEQSVSITDYRKNPGQYFLEEPVAVLSNNKPAGYVLGAELYERMLKLLDAVAPEAKSHFRPASARLEAIAHLGNELLANASEEELGDFKE